MEDGTYTTLSNLRNEDLKAEYDFGKFKEVRLTTTHGKGFFVTNIETGKTQFYNTYQAAKARAKMIVEQQKLFK